MELDLKQLHRTLDQYENELAATYAPLRGQHCQAVPRFERGRTPESEVTREKSDHLPARRRLAPSVDFRAA
jgi:hypothetical protein